MNRSVEKLRLSVLYIFFCVTFLYSAEPIFVLIAHDPWKMVIGSDSPTFAFYSDGKVIFWQSYEKECRRKRGKGYKYYGSFLADSSFISLNNKLLDSNSITSLHIGYETTNATDQVTYQFIWFSKGINKTCSVYGTLDTLKYFKNDPRYFLYSIYETIQQFRPESKFEWHPDFVELMLWSNPNTSNKFKFTAWPDKWPGLKHKTTVNRSRTLQEEAISLGIDTNDVRIQQVKEQYNGTDAYSVYIPYSDCKDLIQFMNKSKGLILIDGYNMSADIRLPFPDEIKWLKDK